MNQRNVIIVTDGDSIAKSAVELAAKNIGGRCISLSAGNPTILSGNEIVNLIKIAKYDPVIVMVDDRGDQGEGKGEEALSQIVQNENIKVLGVVAVASNGKDRCGLKVNFSIDKNGNKVKFAVDKYGNTLDHAEVCGDTLSILQNLKAQIPIVVSIGDPGKMDKKDDIYIGAPITTMALKEILNESNK